MISKAIIFSRKALEDIIQIAEYIAEDSPQSAKAFRENLEKTCGLLSAMPEMGTLREFSNPQLHGVRFIPIKQFTKYLLFYQDRGDNLYISRITHGARDLQALFNSPAYTGFRADSGKMG